MNSHDRRSYNRSWRKDHAHEVAQIIQFIGSKATHYEFDHVDALGVVQMRPKSLTLLGQTKNKHEWRQFLADKGVIDFIA